MLSQPSKTYSNKTAEIAVFATAVLFFLVCVAFVPIIGIQNDEALFATSQYGPIQKEFRLRAFKHDVPLMVMTYLGALKTWVFAAIFSIFSPSIWSIRVPPALIGSVTIILFSILLTKAGNLARAGLIGAILLATDPSFLLTTVYDWGPVAFQHLFLVAGVLLLLQYTHDPHRDRFLSLGFACLGLGLWDKALLSWSLFGLGVATLLVFPTQFWKLLNRRAATIAIASFLAGAAPLVLYNIRTNLKTFRSNTKLSLAEIQPKWVHVKGTLDGSALFGYLVREEWEEKSVVPAAGSAAEASYEIRKRVGEMRRTWSYHAFLLAVAAIPLWWIRRRAVLFAILYLAASWLLMAATHDAGASAHHVVLLWPFPQFVTAIALGCLAERFGNLGLLAAGLATGLLASQNLLVLNQYYTQATRVCGGAVWTDAVEPLRLAVVRRKPATVNIVGWGTEFTLTTLERGALRLRDVAGHVASEPASPEDQAAVEAIASEPGGLFIGHTPELEIQQGAGKRLASAAARAGFRKELLETIYDRCGRASFEVYRFVK
jgi:4-amino-4-deoxy-L-arabinose transferase-like glycosyltransferase